jgi:hypothetical protein
LLGLLFASSCEAGALEAPANSSAKAIWGERAQGKSYRIADVVESDGLYRKYVLETSEGKFSVTGDALMAMRLHEYVVYEQLSGDSGFEHFMGSFGSSAIAPLKFGGQLITSPIETVKQSANGVGNFFDSLSSSSENKDSERGSFMGGVLGTDRARRDLAAQAQVDPYTDFPPLAKRLQELAAARGVGSLSMSGAMMAIPGGAAIPSLTASTTRTVVFSASSVGTAQAMQDAQRTKTAGQIMRDCRAKLAVLAPESEHLDALLDNKNYTPLDLLIIATALERVGAKDSDLFIAHSAQAQDRAAAYLYRQKAEMYAGLARSFPFDRFIVKDGFVLIALKDKRHLLATPADHFFWTQKNRDEFLALGAWLSIAPTAQKGAPAKKDKVLVITGDYSPLARTELTAGNWEPARMTLIGGITASAKPAGAAKPASVPKPPQ